MENDALDSAAQGAANLLKASMGPSDEQRASDEALSNAMSTMGGRIEDTGLDAFDQAFLDDGDEFEAAAHQIDADHEQGKPQHQLEPREPGGDFLFGYHDRRGLRQERYKPPQSAVPPALRSSHFIRENRS